MISWKDLTGNRKIFPDGSSLEWVNRETVEYKEGDFSVLVWIDFEDSFFSNRKVIKASSIKTWNSKPENSPEKIDESKKQEIIGKVQQYYKNNRVEE